MNWGAHSAMTFTFVDPPKIKFNLSIMGASVTFISPATVFGLFNKLIYNLLVWPAMVRPAQCSQVMPGWRVSVLEGGLREVWVGEASHSETVQTTPASRLPRVSPQQGATERSWVPKPLW